MLKELELLRKACDISKELVWNCNTGPGLGQLRDLVIQSSKGQPRHCMERSIIKNLYPTLIVRENDFCPLFLFEFWPTHTHTHSLQQSTNCNWENKDLHLSGETSGELSNTSRRRSGRSRLLNTFYSLCLIF